MTNPVNRKRGLSQVAITKSDDKSAAPRLSKARTLQHVLYDGNTSNSLESSSTTRSKTSVRSHIKRGLSSVKNILHLGDGNSDTGVPQPSEANVVSCHTFPSHCLSRDDCNTTALYRPLKLRLRGIANVSKADGITMSSAAGNPCFVGSASVKFEASSPPGVGVLHDDGHFQRKIRRSQSLPGLQRRISQRLQQAFGNQNTTVVIRPEYRSRPSVNTFNGDSSSLNSTRFSSNPSTLNSGSGSPRDRLGSTPLTSDPVTPNSIIQSERTDTLQIQLQSCHGNAHALCPIPEALTDFSGSIKTVEATASAKAFLEMYFNSILNELSPRAIRHRLLRQRLRQFELSPEAQHQAYKEWQQSETEHLRQTRVLMNTENRDKTLQSILAEGLEVVKILGKGSFGVVRLVAGKGTKTCIDAELVEKHEWRLSPRKQSNSSIIPYALPQHRPISRSRRTSYPAKTQVYAMKVILKSDMIRNSQEGHLRAERDLLVAAAGCRWIISLIAAFQDRKHLYLLMEYCIGGDFLGLLIRKNTLSEADTRFYLAEMVLCVEEAHRMRWIHRDVKPDNFLIAADGHLKISDFGLAFDGEWWHDQKFYHQTRQSLVEKLGLLVEGDDQDKDERRRMESKHHGKTAQNLVENQTDRHQFVTTDQPEAGESVIDWRNRCQRRRLARSVVGTSQYMAPEVVRGDMYDGRCD